MPSIAQPQMIGIAAGCTVFAATIITVLVLLVQGGSIDRLKKELRGEEPAPRPKATQPRLVDELLEARKTLPLKPDLGVASATAGRRGDERALRVVVRRAARGDEAGFGLCRDGCARYGHGTYRAEDVWFDGAPDGLFDDDATAPAPRGEESDGETLVIVDSDAGDVGRVVGAARLLGNRPSHLGVAFSLDWLHPAYSADGEDAPRAPALTVYAVLDRLFGMGYRRVQCILPTADLSRRRLFEASGFALEGVLRKHAIVDDRSRDVAVYAVLNTDWKAGGLAKRLAADLKIQPPRRLPKRA